MDVRVTFIPALGTWIIKNHTLSHDDVWSGTCVTHIRVRPSASGCDACRAELRLAASRAPPGLPLPAEWVCGPGQFDPLWPMVFMEWEVAKVGECGCSGRCLEVEVAGVDAGPVRLWPVDFEEGHLLGHTIVYAFGTCGLVQSTAA